MTTQIQLCSAHSLVAQENTERKKKAERLVNRVGKLTAGGTPLDDALNLIGLSKQKYDKLRLNFDI